ncbi:MAG TPA: TonB-dependent receptor [Puia sp.]|nr:TonB-dependent receptor [Puia sp.]
MKKRLSLLALFCIGCLLAHAQSIKVQGKILERKNGQPLPGAQVSLKASPNQATTADSSGEFTITVPSPKAILVIHAMGYLDREVNVDNRSSFTVSLEQDVSGSLDEIVIVGAVIKRHDLTGSVATIDAKTIGITPTSDINTAIQGKVAGVYVTNSAQPGSAASIKVRGNNSLSYGTSPIYVIDGVIIGDNLNSLNPDDIASMEVLKDASATALYGSRGANGVVLVSTKKGRKNTGQVNYNTWISWSEYERKMHFMNAHDLYNLRADAFANQYMEINPGADRQAYLNRITSDTSNLVFAPYEQQTYRSGKSYDWLDAVSRNGMAQNHTLDFSGGSDKGTYYLSLNYTDQKGLLKGADYKRMGGRINIDQNVKSWLKVGTYTTFTHSITDITDASVFPTAVGANPLLPIDTAGLYTLKWADIQNQDQYNPLRSLYIKNNQYLNRLLSSSYISVTPIKDLIIRTSFSADISNEQQYTYVPTTTGQDLRNSNHGNAIQYKMENYNLQWDNSATYLKSFGEHRFNFLVATSMQQNTSNYNSITAYGFPNDDFGYMYLGGVTNKDRTVLASDFTTTTMMSYLGRVEYGWKDKYFATATLRYDGSSKFGANHKWGAFPSLAVAWDMSRENFMSKVSVITHWKWRVGYGIAGNQNIPDYAFKTLYRPSYTNGTVTYVNDGRLGNPDLQWEKQKQLNIGADIGIFNDRINLTADYFNIKNDKLLIDQTLALTSGFSNTVANVGALQNKGIEFTLDYAIVRKKDLQWNFRFMISRDVNKVTKLYGNTTAIYNKGGYTGVEIQRTGNYFVGQSINTIYSYKFSKIAQVGDTAQLSGINFGGRTVHPGDIVPVDKDGNHIINDDDRYVVGKTDPNFYGGFGTDITYKGFGINVFFNYSSGLKRISSLYEGGIQSDGMEAASTDMLNRWTPTHTNTNIPRAVYGIPRFNVSDVDLGVQNASFLRMSVLSLSYTLPKKAAKNMFDNARIYVTGSNLLLLTKDKGYDPETGDGFPNTKSVSIGLNLSL